MRTMTTLAVALFACWLAAALFMFFVQERLLFLPDIPSREVTATPAAIGLDFEPVTLNTEDGESLDAWFVSAPGATRTVIHFHGNAGNIGHRLELLELLHGLPANVLLFDYRGYGRSTGKPGEHGTYRDATAAWKYLTETRAIPPAEIVLHGQSMGGPVAAWLAARVTPGALALDATFTSVADVGAELYRWLPVRLAARIGYHTREELKKVRSPVLVMHSRDDEIIPFHHGRDLFAAANEPKRFLEYRGDHNGGFLASRDAYEAALRELIAGSAIR